MTVQRKKNVPVTPATLGELAEVLAEYPPTQNLYKGCVEGADGSKALLFMHDDMLQPLANCTQLFCDGTFKIRPRRPRCAQIFIIHFRKMTSGFPAVFAFTSSKTTEIYAAIWTRLFELIPTLQMNIKSVTSDFERAQINSAKNNFPAARISGCLFHYKQAIAKRWKKLLISIQYEFILEKAYAGDYLPSNKIEEGVGHVMRLIDDIWQRNEPEKEKLQAFGTYLRNTWVPLADVVSCYKKPIKTNNTCENFHLYVSRQIGERPNVWKMLDQLTKLIYKINGNYQRVEAGFRIACNRPRDLQVADVQILKAESELELGRYNVEEFLSNVAAQRCYNLARLHRYNEANRRSNALDAPAEESDSSEEEIVDINFLANNLNSDVGPGDAFENELVIRRRRRNNLIRDVEQMPEVLPAEAGSARGRRGRPTINNNLNLLEPPVRRGRGRPRRAIVVNEPQQQMENIEFPDNPDPPRIEMEEVPTENVDFQLPNGEDNLNLPRIEIDVNVNLELPIQEQNIVQEPPRKKRKNRRRGRNCAKRVQKLRPCGHRVCMVCIPQMMTDKCPYCREKIISYLPEHKIGPNERLVVRDEEVIEL